MIERYKTGDIYRDQVPIAKAAIKNAEKNAAKLTLNTNTSKFLCKSKTLDFTLKYKNNKTLEITNKIKPTLTPTI